MPKIGYMKSFSTDFFEMELHDTFVILTVSEGESLTLQKANIIRKELSTHFKNKKFVMINNRKYNNEIADEIYKQGQLSNMQGLAIVSKEKDERDKALIEQKLYDKSFAFFDTLSEAISWAENYFF